MSICNTWHRIRLIRERHRERALAARARPPEAGRWADLEYYLIY